MSAPINFICKPFSTLTIKELYGLLALRQQVFVVEQNCPYPDSDFKDQDAWHVLGQDEDSNIIGYARLLPKGVSYPDHCSIGRIVTHPDFRDQQIGSLLIKESIKHCQILFGGACSIKISAQTHLKDYYARHGFQATDKYYLEDGIPHVEMLLIQKPN